MANQNKKGAGNNDINAIESKGRSPFFPDQPVPVELFVGRSAQIDHIMTRGVGQVAQGKPVSVFLEGEYGIGKTSFARFTQWMAERNNGLLGIYATLERAETMDEVGAAVLEATLRSGAYNPKLGEKIREGMAKFVGQQSLFGLPIHAEALREQAPNITRGLLPFLGQTLERVRSDGATGVFLVVDEINGLANNPQFAAFLKAVVDSNAAISLEKPTLPLLLMVCGVEERRRQLIAQHESVGRIFDVVSIERMTVEEMDDFFRKAFESVHMMVDSSALNLMTYCAAGFPKIMHLIGNAAYWLDQDGRVDEDDAGRAIASAAEEVGKRYVNQQVYAALHSADYHSILAKIAKMAATDSFMKRDVEEGLTEGEKRKLNNFLQKMKRLKVLRSGDVQGEYVFNMRMVRLYIWMRSIRTTGA
ncbi:MAG: ATP-binding protein [Terriglobia bacterium]|jgi:Cdc6-like AAA superfamily ATPase